LSLDPCGAAVAVIRGALASLHLVRCHRLKVLGGDFQGVDKFVFAKLVDARLGVCINGGGKTRKEAGGQEERWGKGEHVREVQQPNAKTHPQVTATIARS
jgi:hypothetical protein